MTPQDVEENEAVARPQPTENDVEAAGQVTAKYKNGVWANFDVYWSEMETDIAAALAQRGDGKDAERLDSLEEAGANVSFYRDPLMDGLRWTVSWVDYKAHRAKGNTLREAIDAAIAAQKEKVGG